MTDALERNGRLELVIGDITAERVDAIGNAANAALAGGGGVDGAIHRAAGRGLMAELRQRHSHGTPTGTAVATAAYDLQATWVLHAVGPRWRGGDHGEAELLAGAYRSCLSLCDELGATSLALPAISLGIYGYPLEAGATIAVTTVAAHLDGDTSLRLVRFVLRRDTYPAFEAALASISS
ncbi:MAG TPA: macro domain-containing protein [Candidatus Limnocylindria bacterium]|nr:macro domain-containing protein [Candidatus Limnocylindria bacterium]